ncbi:MAG: PQQ-binding-like beta-propeller repeat protein [Bryobacterales bacterium]
MTTRLALLALALASLLAAQNWPQWRGPNGDGTSPARDLPLSWSETENIAWRVELPSWAAATPIVWGDVVFVTSAEQGFAGHKGSGQAGAGDKDKLLLIAINRKDGSERWRRVMGDHNHIGNKQNMASPTPVTDGKHVWTMTGNGRMAMWDFDGNKGWERNLEADYGKFGLQFGYGSSPILDGGKLYVQVLHGFHTDEPCYLLALDAATGKTLWKVERPTDAQHESPDSYSTATIGEINGKRQLIVSGADYITGHDLATGRELWREGGLNPNKDLNYRTIASPLVVGDMVFAPSRRRPFIAFKLGREPERMWTTDYGPDVPTPTSDGERLYIIDDRGVALCLNVKDGATIYDRTRIEPGTYSASPVLADGKIYAISEDGATSVIAAGGEFRLLSVNKLNDYTLATPAVSDGQIFIRTSQYLYCIGKRSGRAD